MSSFLKTIVDNSADGQPLIEWKGDGTFDVHDRSEVLRSAQVCAYNLSISGVSAGDTVCLMQRTSISLIITWLGALCVRAVPTILPPPNDRQDTALWVGNVRHIVEYTGAAAVIVTREVRQAVAPLLDDLDIALLDGTSLLTGEQAMDFPGADGEGAVILQHSSGTTGLQKGVALTSDQLLLHIEQYGRAIQLQPETDKIISWLPYYHDMGLIACLVMPLVTNTCLVFMDNFTWALQPALLLRAINEHCTTLCWLPNFAFNFLASRVSDGHKEGLDLSSMRLWVNCSEPVKRESFDRFIEHFREQGVKPTTMASCYAMAENTFAVTQSRPGTMSKSIPFSRQSGKVLPAHAPIEPTVTWITSSGERLPQHEIRIQDAAGADVASGTVGEIFIKSPCMMDDYFGPTRTGAVDDGWYASGDLGLIHESELFVCGRKKDVIIVAGHNIFPEDVEAILNEIDLIQPGRTVTFGIYTEEEGTEQLIALAELKPCVPQPTVAELRAINRRAKQRIADELGTTLRDLRRGIVKCCGWQESASGDFRLPLSFHRR